MSGPGPGHRTLGPGSVLPAVETLAWLLAARAALTLLPFRRIVPFLGRQGGESPSRLPEEDLTGALEVAHRVRAANQRLPWECSCLVRSLASMAMLRRRGLEGTFYLGVREWSGQLRAHAWVRCGDVYVAGGRRRRPYSVIDSFSRAE